MNRINIDNYEAFLLDFTDGTLDEETFRELKAFAAIHPELEIDLNDLNLPVITDEVIEFDLKSTLRKTDAAVSSETLFDYLEGNLSQTEREEIEVKLLTNKALKQEFDLFKKTILSADPQESFTNNTALYKTSDDLVAKDKVLAYFENQLIDSEKVAVEQELKVNASLQKELALYSKTKLTVDGSITYPEKEELKKWALAYFEGLLSVKEKAEFETELKVNADLQKELALYSKTKLVADAAVSYPNKKELKKETKVIALFNFRNRAALAAAILLVVGLFVVVNRYTAPDTLVKPELASHVKKDQPAAQTASVSVVARDQVKSNPEKTLQTTVQTASVKPTRQVTVPSGNPPLQTNFIQPQINNQASNIAVQQPEKQEMQKQEIKQEPLIAREQKLNKPARDLTEDSSVVAETQEKYTVLLAMEDTGDDEVQAPAKKGFWNKAVKLAKGANKLGIKAVDGSETSKRKFSLSFNSFSVEKH